MSEERFDPENVDEFCADRYANETAQCVYRRDYMKLLELWREVQPELRMARGLKALLANGMPQTGNPAFNEILATQPIAEMIQRGWLGSATGFDDLPALEWEICHFYGVKTIEEAVNPPFPPGRKS